MAAITIRNLSDDVVSALKESARRHGRSMEAEGRAVLAQLTAGASASGAEQVLAEHVTRPRSVPWTDVVGRLLADPPPLADQAWVDELHAQRDDDPIADPWDPRAAS